MHTEDELIYDWNRAGTPGAPVRRPELDDETLRDGLQSPSATDPPLEEKRRILHLMEALGIDACDLGLPAAGPRALETCAALAREIVTTHLRIRPNCAVRTHREDIDRLFEVADRAGAPVEAAMFIGTSPIRLYAEEWELDWVRRRVADGVAYAAKRDIPVLFVTEDTTRSRPEHLREIFRTAIEAGARRLCLTDTVGFATPPGVAQLVRFTREVIAETGEPVRLDWHGHADRGLAMANAMAAVAAGVDRIHATALGLGERVGNVAMDQLLVNLRLEGLSDADLSRLPEYCEAVSRAVCLPIPPNYPVLGRDAFRTSTGVHAAAIIKAQHRGARWLADRVYSSVPAEMVGRRHEIEIGFMSGLSNVVYYLRSRGIEPQKGLVEEILRAARRHNKVLTEEEIYEIIRFHGEQAPQVTEELLRRWDHETSEGGHVPGDMPGDGIAEGQDHRDDDRDTDRDLDRDPDRDTGRHDDRRVETGRSVGGSGETSGGF